MIKIKFDEPSNDDWQAWRRRCEKATAQVCDARASGDRHSFNEGLYKAMWNVYLSAHGPFHGKCAYCESKIDADQPGDIDHFRPKSKVTDLEDQIVEVGTDHINRTFHPGYYWLAYDWRNLLPACAECNRPSSRKTRGALVGKGTRFPVNGNYAFSPGAESSENPLLINPASPEDEDPSLHMTIDDLGVVNIVTERGAACVRVFGLNEREGLVRKRKEALEAASDYVLTLVDAWRGADQARLNRCLERLEAFKNGSAAYSAAGRTGMKIGLAIELPFQESLLDALERLTAPSN